jgi:hemoglobin-like flavoprotein
MVSDSELLTRSLDAIGEKGIDIMPAVYSRFFQQCPEAETLFNGKERAVLGKMLNEVLMSALDCASHANFLHGLLTTQANDHMGWGVTANMYGAFFNAMLDVIQESLGSHWDKETQGAWQRQCVAMQEIMIAAHRNT